MNTRGSLFSQILPLFSRSDFQAYVRAIKCEYRAKGFSSWEQFVAMMFCQLAQKSIGVTSQGRVAQIGFSADKLNSGPSWYVFKGTMMGRHEPQKDLFSYHI